MKYVSLPALVLTAFSLAACANGELVRQAPNGDLVGPPIGSSALPGGDPTQAHTVSGTYCPIRVSVRERHYNTANRLIGDYEVGVKTGVVYCWNKVALEKGGIEGTCWKESPRTRRINHYGNLAHITRGVNMQRVRCGSMLFSDIQMPAGYQ